MAEEDTTTGQAKTHVDHVRLDVPCVKCGFNLKTLEVTGKCSECGEWVAASLSTRRLAHADVGWLKRVRQGAHLQLLGSVTQVGSIVSAFLFGPGRVAQSHPEAVIYIFLGVIVCAAIAMLIGMWMLTTPNMGVLAEGSGNTWRTLLRLWLVVDVISVFIIYGAAQLSRPYDALGSIVAVAVVTGQVFFTFKYTQELGALGGDRWLPGFASVGAGMSLGMGGWWLVVFIAFMASGSQPGIGSQFRQLISCCGCMTGLVCILIVLQWHIALMLLWSLLTFFINAKQGVSQET